MNRLAAFVLVIVGINTLANAQPLGLATDEEIEALISDMQTMSYRGRSWPPLEYASIPRLVQLSRTDTGIATFTKLVSLGPRALPALIRHLTDSRATDAVVQRPIAGLHVGLFIFDSRSGPVVELNIFEKENQPESYTYKVGDLCYSAIGKIVNRDFRPVMSLSSGKSLLIGSPNRFPILVELTKKDWAGLTPAEHRKHLISDATSFNAGSPRKALEALMHFYPTQGEQTVLDLLSLPFYSQYVMDFSIDNQFMKTDDTGEWQRLHKQVSDEFTPGVANMLAREIVDDQDRYFYYDPSNELKRSQTLVKTLFPKFDGVVNHSFSALEFDDLANVLYAVENFPTARIDAAVQGVFRRLINQPSPLDVWNDRVRERDWLALQCATRMIGKGFEDEYLKYFRERLAVVDPKMGPTGYLREDIEKMVRQMSGTCTTK